jgi:hypothetical protein
MQSTGAAEVIKMPEPRRVDARRKYSSSEKDPARPIRFRNAGRETHKEARARYDGCEKGHARDARRGERKRAPRVGRLASAYPALAAYLATLPPKVRTKIEQSFSAATSPSHVRRASRSLWDVAGRTTPEAFVRLIEKSRKLSAVVAGVVALPAEMLVLPAAGGHRNYVKVCSDWFPRASAFWPSIISTLDMAIIRARRHHDAALLAELAGVAKSDQVGWFERALVSPVLARRYYAAPTWARPFIELAQREAMGIWEALTTLIHSIAYGRSEPPVEVAKMTGRQLNWIAGLTFGNDPARVTWLSIYNAAGFALTSGQARLEDFVFNRTGKGTPWTRW